MTLELIGTTVGLVYLWLEYRANIYVWLAGIIMPAIYTVVYYRAGLYADCAINVYYILAAAYGVMKWVTPSPALPRNAGEGETNETGEGVVHTPLAMLPRLFGAFVLLWGAIALALMRLTDSTVPIADAFTTALSIVAMYMLAHRHAEQWIAWIVVDAVCTGLYIYKGLNFTAALYALYALVAVAGYCKWNRMISRQ